MSNVNAVDRWWKALIGSGLSSIDKTNALNDINAASNTTLSSFTSEVQSATGFLDTRVGSNETDITTLQVATGFLDTGVRDNEYAIGGLASYVNSINSRVSSNETYITDLESATGDLDTRVDSNETDITTLQVYTNGIEVRVASNETDITTLQGATGFLDTGKADESVISDYLGPVDLTSAASISWDINNGNQANLTGLSVNTTVTLSNLENGETFSLAGTQGGTGKYSLSIDMAGMDVKGDTTSIAELNSDEYFMVAGRRMNTGILLSTITYPT
jgi:hypothetical protein